ncbi:transglutaminase domain-containing protein [Clostridium butyricum]|uniref:transglutaminase domain-containing protein n=1 Tax=Clostridium butyricum TaxID=1492 RepID=UPI0030FEC4AF
MNLIFDTDNVYTALTTKSTICQGYAMTVYKMLNILGIDCRIINGDKSGTSHAWNLVKIDGVWYHLDSTNNDNIVRDKYLLKSDDYMIENGFTWDKTQYPSASSNYFLNKTEYLDYNNDKENDISEYYEGGYWYKDNNSKWHYKRNSGYEVMGWFKYNNNWYYFGEDCIMKTGWINTDGNWYYLYSNGMLATNTSIDGYSLDENGVLH